MTTDPTSPLVRSPVNPDQPTTLAETLTPPTEETTPVTPVGRRPANRSRTSRSRSATSPPRGRGATSMAEATEARAIDEEDPILPPEATEIDEATGPAATRRPRNPTRPRRAAGGGASAGADGGSSRAEATRNALNQISDAGQRGAARKGNATAANWEEFLAVLFGFLSMLYMWWLVAGFEVPRDERDSLMLQEEEADALARPMARILARSWLNDAYGKHVLGATDYVVLAIAVAEYTKRTAPYARRKAATYGPIRRRTTPTMESRSKPATEASNGHVDGEAARPRPVIYPASAT